MESSKMKNMVILRNLPSNMVEEAIIIFRQTQKIKQKEFVDRGNKIKSVAEQTKSKEYILKEAEMLVTDYINKLETKKDKIDINIKQKYNKLKKYSIISTIVLIISLIINFI